MLNRARIVVALLLVTVATTSTAIAKPMKVPGLQSPVKVIRDVDGIPYIIGNSEHDVLFAGLGERIVLRHVATDRAIFARGALHAARWIAGRPAGLYDMQDVLGLKD